MAWQCNRSVWIFWKFWFLGKFWENLFLDFFLQIVGIMDTFSLCSGKILYYWGGNNLSGKFYFGLFSKTYNMGFYTILIFLWQMFDILQNILLFEKCCFLERFGFLENIGLFCKILDLWKNWIFWKKWIFYKILDFLDNIRFFGQYWIFSKILDFFENIDFLENISFLGIFILDFCGKYFKSTF